MEREFSFKELYSVKLKATYPLSMDGVEIEPGEVIAEFDKIQISNFEEVRKYVTAHGGFDDRAHVIWESTKQLNFQFIQGIFTKTQLSLILNAKLGSWDEREVFLLSKRETLESDENGHITLSNSPNLNNPVFVYNQETGAKLKNLSMAGDKVIVVPEVYTNYVVDYQYDYDNEVKEMLIGERALDGFLELEGRTRVKDDETGLVKTGIIKIPKLKLTSALSIRLGKNANPVVGNFTGIGCPVGERGKERVMEFYFLEDDIDSDI